MIEPTVGRAIWYRPPGSHPAAQPHAAHVAFVHDLSLINLLIIGHDGIAYPGTEILLIQEGQQAPSAEDAPRGYAEWMPFQKGQAAKTEALQAAAQVPAPGRAPQGSAEPAGQPTANAASAAPADPPAAPAPVVAATPAEPAPSAQPASPAAPAPTAATEAPPDAAAPAAAPQASTNAAS